MEFCCKHISKIRNTSLGFENFGKNFKIVKKIEKIDVDFEKSPNSFETKKKD